MPSKVWFLVALAAAPSGLFANNPPPVSLPDAGSSALLLTVSALGIFAARRFLANRK